MSFNLFGIAGKRVAVAVHDGQFWHVRIFTHAKGDWRLKAEQRFPGTNPQEVPEEALAFASDHDAGRLRVLTTGRVFAIEAALPEDSDFEEMHTALAYEMAEETDIEPSNLRLAAVRSDAFRMGGEAGRILAAAFSNDWIQALDNKCRKYGLRLEGVGSLELTLLNYHAIKGANKRFLMVGWHNSLYATPATVAGPFSVQGLQTSFTKSDAESHPGRYERLAKHFQSHAQHPIVCWLLQPHSAYHESILDSVLNGDTEVAHENFHDHIEDVSRHAADAPKVGTLTHGCPLVGKAGKTRDPHRAGTWFFFAVILLCGAVLGFIYMNLSAQLKSAQVRQEAWKTLETERNRLDAEAQALRAQRDASIPIVDLLSREQRLPVGLLSLMEALSRDIPMYTRLIRLYQDPHGDFVLEGATFYQAGLEQLNRKLSAALQPLGLFVETFNITEGQARNETYFSCRIIGARKKETS